MSDFGTTALDRTRATRVLRLRSIGACVARCCIRCMHIVYIGSNSTQVVSEFNVHARHGYDVGTPYVGRHGGTGLAPTVGTMVQYRPWNLVDMVDLRSADPLGVKGNM